VLEAPGGSSGVVEDRASNAGMVRPCHGQHGYRGQRLAVSGTAATGKQGRGWSVVSNALVTMKQSRGRSGRRCWVRSGDGTAATAEGKVMTVHRQISAP
jgi:hypothetical protein